MFCIGAVVDCFISAGLILGQKWAVVSVGLVLGSGRLYHISRTSTATDIDCVVSLGLVGELVDCTISVRLVLGQKWIV